VYSATLPLNVARQADIHRQYAPHIHTGPLDPRYP
jgi:hypothetical protein